MFRKFIAAILLATVVTVVGCGPEEDIETRREVTIDVEQTRSVETVIE
jgi:hypothetical protein